MDKQVEKLIKLEEKRQREKLFGVPHVNVQPYSGSPANAAAIMALIFPILRDKSKGFVFYSRSRGPGPRHRRLPVCEFVGNKLKYSH